MGKYPQNGKKILLSSPTIKSVKNKKQIDNFDLIIVGSSTVPSRWKGSIKRK
jgi:hypothetical protein